jgi:flagellar biosynthesis/type III secretory pathway protein FliH
MRLVRGLYGRGLQRRDVQHMFRFIDWMMELPTALSEQFWHEVQALEEEKKMPYVTSVERMAEARGIEQGRKQGLQQGLQQGLALGLKLKFGPSGRKLMPRIKRIEDIAVLEALQRSLDKAATLDEFRDALP